jgi:hypothetical protein
LKNENFNDVNESNGCTKSSAWRTIFEAEELQLERFNIVFFLLDYQLLILKGEESAFAFIKA